MNQGQLIEKWKEVVATANNGDPEYSFRLFSELVASSSNKCAYCDHDKQKHYDGIFKGDCEECANGMQMCGGFIESVRLPDVTVDMDKWRGKPQSKCDNQGDDAVGGNN